MGIWLYIVNQCYACIMFLPCILPNIFLVICLHYWIRVAHVLFSASVLVANLYSSPHLISPSRDWMILGLLIRCTQWGRSFPLFHFPASRVCQHVVAACAVLRIYVQADALSKNVDIHQCVLVSDIPWY